MTKNPPLVAPPGAAEFFADMRERHAIYLRRQAGQPWPWTEDPVMLQYSITNPFRENDRTTRWLKDNVREGLRTKPEVLLAIAVFRWFNRITTGDAIFKAHGSISVPIGNGATLDVDSSTAWGLFLETGRVDILRAYIVSRCGKGPYVTGSYIIQGWRGMSKLDGVLKCIENFYQGEWKWVGQVEHESFAGEYAHLCNWREVGHFLLQNRGKISLETMWLWLRQVPYLGDFMAHEIVQDLRYTDLLDQAPDINTWSNPGPGAARGLARVYGREIIGNTCDRLPKSQMITEMRELLELSRDARYWPQRTDKGWQMVGTMLPVMSLIPAGISYDETSWPALELHQIEMWLCEYQKIVKTRTGEGRPRGRYKPG